MKKALFLWVVLVTAAFTWVSTASALPFLQLDISDGVYDTNTETVVSTGSAFTLYALVDPGSAEYMEGVTYYISAAISPMVEDPADLGFFTFGGMQIDVTDDMIYGTPPIDEVAESQNLPGHGVFPTYFTEFSFTLDPGNTAMAYNVQDNPGGFQVGGDLLYQAFLVDVSGLDPEYAVHFDFYTKNEDGTIDKFAPFSHDAQSAPVPEPATMILLGTGLVGLAGFGRKKVKSNR